MLNNQKDLTAVEEEDLEETIQNLDEVFPGGELPDTKSDSIHGSQKSGKSGKSGNKSNKSGISSNSSALPKNHDLNADDLSDTSEEQNTKGKLESSLTNKQSARDYIEEVKQDEDAANANKFNSFNDSKRSTPKKSEQSYSSFDD